MTFSDTEMKELGRGTAHNTHNITSLIRTLKHVSDILQTEEVFTVEEYKHTHTHTHTNTHTHTHTHTHTNTHTHSSAFAMSTAEKSIGYSRQHDSDDDDEVEYWENTDFEDRGAFNIFEFDNEAEL